MKIIILLNDLCAIDIGAEGSLLPLLGLPLGLLGIELLDDFVYA